MFLAGNIAKRLLTAQASGQTVAGPVVKLARVSVAMGMVVMLISLAVGFGFKEQIRNKLVGFGSSVIVTQFDYNQSFETNPIGANTVLEQAIGQTPGVKTVNKFVLKPGMIKTKEAVQAIALKGVPASYDTLFISSVLTQGRWIFSQSDSLAQNLNIVLGEALARKLGLSVGDDVRMYFVQNGIRARKFRLVGVYSSHLQEYDDRFAFVDIAELRRLNNWSMDESTGIEVGITDFDRLDDVADEVVANVMAAEHGDEKREEVLRVQTIRDMESQMFAWLDLLDTNIAVILVLIIAVAGLNMTTGLLILILEHTQTIGLLKSLGATDVLVRRVFLHMAVSIVGKGMLWGNVIGLLLCVFQYYTGFVTLDPRNYYLDCVPISFSFGAFVLLNVVTLTVLTLLLIAPTYIISRIRPAQAMRIE